MPATPTPCTLDMSLSVPSRGPDRQSYYWPISSKFNQSPPSFTLAQTNPQQLEVLFLLPISQVLPIIPSDPDRSILPITPFKDHARASHGIRHIMRLHTTGLGHAKVPSLMYTGMNHSVCI